MFVKTLSMETIDLDEQTGYFQGQTSPKEAIEPVGPDGQTGPFSRLNKPHNRSRLANPPILKVKRAQSSLWIYGDLEFQRDFWQKFSWTSFKTLAIEPVGPNGQTDPFFRSNKP
ncbi:hypothetical protein H5410_042202 [Solanum commersonii]|uniref:Uncharacterized protein n=1 Tax=Solanum commersonii TaxID=4109 RepID=A0A9J5XWU4_SOLCO|nr:hypothetical protein H5410_042202 [Solanum commersonii]